MKVRTVDLFAGCGGLSKGLESAGYEVVLAVESWQAARETYARNFGHPVTNLDLGNIIDAIHVVRTHRPEIIVGGPPCQEFSAAGSRTEGKKARLTICFAEIVRAVRPSYFLMENVPEAKSSRAWRDARSLLERAGFGVTEMVLDAADYGVPQRRKRFFAIGSQGADHDFLADDLLLAAKDPLSVRDYLGDEFTVDHYYRHPRNWGRRAVFSIDELSPTIRSTNRPVPPGYKPHPLDSAPAHTVRHLTVSERARIQTFPRGFRFSSTLTDQDIMVANAVPVQLARSVGAAIMGFHEARTVPESDAGFRRWLTVENSYTPRTAGNVLSRLRRVSRFLQEPRVSGEPLDVIHRLEKLQDFQQLSSAVRSQLKQAVRLHAEFSVGQASRNLGRHDQ